MTDIVYIRGLRAEAVIGVYAWERSLRQELLFDLEMAVDTRVAAGSDSIADALDYHAVALRVQSLAAATRFHLVETLAENVAGALIAEFGLSWLRLRLDKPGALDNATGVGVVIERGSRHAQ